MPDDSRNPLSADDSPESTVTTPGSGARRSPVPAVGPGSVLAGRYQLEAVIGRGGSGAVFRAWDRVLGDPIAIKILHADRAQEKSWIGRLAREVKVARAIRHPNVCRVFELGESDGLWFVTMELATRGSLRDQLHEAKPRPLAERLEDARALCAGLAAIHAVGITHRDVTPQNVLRLEDGRLVLSDFGLAIEKPEETTIHGGTPNYMPPETAMGQIADRRADVWQLGAILHEILFGHRPEWEPLADGVTMKGPLPPDASPVEEELERLCRDCLAQNPAARPATAMEVVGRLAAAEVARPRTAVERAWLRARGLARRYRWLGLTLAGLLVVAGVARAVQVAVRPPLCRAGGKKLDGIWDMRTKAQVRRAFEQTSKSYATASFWRVNRLIESYLAGWVAIYTEACEATQVRGEQSAEVLDLRMSCLQGRLDETRALSQLLLHADGDIVDNAADAANALGTLERCADQRLLRAVLPPPESAAARTEVERIRRGIAEAKALQDAGNFKRAAARLKALVADARRAGYAPALAEALALLGMVDVNSSDNVAADAALKEAFLLAEASRHDEVKAEAATFLVASTGRRDHFEESDQWAQQADATLKRIGGQDRMRGWLETHLGFIRMQQGKNEEALAHGRRAVELKERSGASRSDIARTLNNMALALRDLGRSTEAVTYMERTVAETLKEVSVDHPVIAILLSNQGDILNRAGRYAEARAVLERAFPLAERSFGKDSPILAHTLFGLGDNYVRDRKPAAAIPPLERALRIREARESDAGLVADTDFLLARALSDAGQDRARARALAEHARTIYAGQPTVAAARIAEVDRWLTGARAARVR